MRCLQGQLAAAGLNPCYSYEISESLFLTGTFAEDFFRSIYESFVGFVVEKHPPYQFKRASCEQEVASGAEARSGLRRL